MARSASRPLADTPAVERSPAKACSESPHPIDNERKHRNGVPIKRNQRLHLELPVAVYALSSHSEPEPLIEAARSAVVYPTGCVLGLGATVELGQELLLVNPQNNRKVVCRVAGFESQKNGSQPTVRLEFTQPVPKFWGVMFPPEHADPAERKLPRPSKSARQRIRRTRLPICASPTTFRVRAFISRVTTSAIARACVSPSASCAIQIFLLRMPATQDRYYASTGSKTTA